jgi:WhiB family transcriptional regulator, redox-sensing transcriptional regulator
VVGSARQAPPALATVVGQVNDELVFFDEHRPPWQADAACAGMPTEDFFPAGSTGAALDRLARVKAICAVCPVARQCLEYALNTGQHGVWGGMSEDERHTERRRRQRQRRGG